MSNYQNDDDQEQEHEKEGIAALRAAADAGREATKKNLILEKKVAFMEAGISPLTEVGGMLFDTWDGQDIEALKAKAIRLGALEAPKDPASPPEPQKSQEEIDALNRLEAENRERQALQEKLGGGGQPAGQGLQGAHPIDSALEQYQKDRRAGVDEAIAQRDAVAKVLTKGLVERDPRLRYDHDAHLAAGREADREFEGGIQGH